MNVITVRQRACPECGAVWLRCQRCGGDATGVRIIRLRAGGFQWWCQVCAADFCYGEPPMRERDERKDTR